MWRTRSHSRRRNKSGCKRQIASHSTKRDSSPCGRHLSHDDAEWFREYVKNHATEVTLTHDIKAIEKQLKFKLPKSYLDFVTKVGPVSFENADEQKGATVRILGPGDLDSETFRAGELDTDDEETNAVDGVKFAESAHGDCFCFDVQKGKKEFPIFMYKHEYNMFEPYAENFAACIKRFAAE